MASEEMQQAATLLRAQRQAAAGKERNVVEMRQFMKQMLGALAIPAELELEDVTMQFGDRSIAGRWHYGPDSLRNRCLLYLHGGGYCLGDLDTHKELMARLAVAAGVGVLGVDYRLAPENPYPAAVDDAVDSYQWLLKQGFPSDRIAIAGDSAGGGLTLATLLSLNMRDLPQPACAALLSPWTDLAATGDSIQTRLEADPMIEPSGIHAMAANYRAGKPADHPLISPLYGDLSGLPPLLVQVGENEILLDDSTRLRQRADMVGTPLELRIYAGAFHVFQAFPSVPEADEAVAEIGAFMRKHYS